MKLKSLHIGFVVIVVSLLGVELGHSNADDNLLPNIVFMMADDMGMGDTSAYLDVTGNDPSAQVSTPNMEKLALMGIRFTDAHTPSSRCTGTRYGLMTGRYPWRNRMKHWVLFGAQGDPMIEADRPTLASLLKDQGYRTAIVGKWHVGLRYRRADGTPAAGWEDAELTQPLHTTPVDHGFDFARFTSRSHGTSGPDAGARDPSKVRYNGPGHVHDRIAIAATGDGKKLKTTGPDAYVLTKLGSRHSDHAIEFIKGHIASKPTNQRPFFLYYPSNSNHGPYTPDESIGGKPVKGAARSVSGAAMSTRYDFIYENDVALGRLIDCLEAYDDPRRPGGKLLENTLIVFTSDNGAEIRPKTATGPFRSNKGSAFEGGHRVPFIAAWERGGVGDGSPFTPGVTSSARIGLIDMFATFCDMTGAELPSLEKGGKGGEDSRSVLAQMQGKQVLPSATPPVFHNDHNESKKDKAHAAFRMDDPIFEGQEYVGQWKLFFDEQLLRFGVAKPYQLFDLASDPREQVNRIGDSAFSALVSYMSEQALLHRNSGGHRWAELVEAKPTHRVVWAENSSDLMPWLNATPTEHSASAPQLKFVGPATNGDPERAKAEPTQSIDGFGVKGGNPRLVDAGEAVWISFDRDVLVEWVALKAGAKGKCGGYYRVGNGAPLAIYCTDADNDAKDQHGVLSDIGLLKSGEQLQLESSPHLGCESAGAWKLQAIQYRVLD